MLNVSVFLNIPNKIVIIKRKYQKKLGIFFVILSSKSKAKTMYIYITYGIRNGRRIKTKGLYLKD